MKDLYYLLYYLSQTITGPLVLAVRVLQNRVCMSFHPFISPLNCPAAFLELDHYFFVNFGMVLETHVKLCMTESKILENREKVQFVL